MMGCQGYRGAIDWKIGHLVLQVSCPRDFVCVTLTWALVPAFGMSLVHACLYQAGWSQGTEMSTGAIRDMWPYESTFELKGNFVYTDEGTRIYKRKNASSQWELLL